MEYLLDSLIVIPAKAGIYVFLIFLDPGFRRDDDEQINQTFPKRLMFAPGWDVDRIHAS